MARVRNGAVGAVVLVMMLTAALSRQVWAEAAADAAVDDGVPPISLNLRDVSIRTALAAIADVTGLNLVASDSVSGRVTLNLVDVPGSRPWLDSRKSWIGQSSAGQCHHGGARCGAGQAGPAGSAGWECDRASLVTEHLRIKYAKAMDLADMLRGETGIGLLTQRGRVAVDARTNTLLVQDTADRVAAIRRMLARLDVAVRQVRIEARIVIARDSVARELGIDWGVSANEGHSPNGINAAGASSGIAEDGGLAVDLGSARSPGTTFGFGYLSGDVLLDLELRAWKARARAALSLSLG